MPDSVDLGKALIHVKKTDLVDVPVPDILRCADELIDEAAVIAAAQGRLEGGPPGPALEIPVDKGAIFTRRMTLLAMEDRVAFQAAVASFADRIEKRTSDSVYSARLSEDPRYFTKRSSEQWAKWRESSLSKLEPGSEWLVETDLTSYFDTIRHRQLIADIESLNADSRIIGVIREMLRKWAPTDGLGLPQGPNASRVLGNLFMLPIDEAMLNAGWRYSRFLDDVQIVTDSKPAAIQAMREFQRECGNRGLIVSSAKTKLLHGDEARKSLEGSGKLAAIEYFLNANAPRLARKQLKAVLKEALAPEMNINVREARFSLYRLGNLREPTVLTEVLNRLEDLAPIASVVAAYLPPFISEDIVEDGLAKFLSDPDRSYSAHLATWLLAAMLERPGPLPEPWVNEAARRMKNRNQPVYLRSVAAVVAGRGRRAMDIAWIKREIRQEHNPALLRSFAVGLFWAGELDRAVQKELVILAPQLQRTIGYLQGRTKVPSLVFSSRSLNVPTLV